MDTTTILVMLITGSYVFTAGCYALVWRLSIMVSKEIISGLRNEVAMLTIKLDKYVNGEK